MYFIHGTPVFSILGLEDVRATFAKSLQRTLRPFPAPAEAGVSESAGQRLFAYLQTLLSELAALGEGESLLVPGGWRVARVPPVLTQRVSCFLKSSIMVRYKVTTSCWSLALTVAPPCCTYDPRRVPVDAKASAKLRKQEQAAEQAQTEGEDTASGLRRTSSIFPEARRRKPHTKGYTSTSTVRAHNGGFQLFGEKSEFL